MLYRISAKIVIDFMVSVMIIVISMPVFLLTTTFLFISLRGNPFFFQVRPGYKGKLFKIIKFKTMLDTRDENGMLLPDHQRLFGLGRIIRSLSIDEMPQLFNVIRGDMSIVGPRPLLPEYLALYSSDQIKRHNVKPGITGWAQVNGRNALSWDEKFKLDIWYVEHVSFLLDLKIIFLTIKKVIKRDGISSDTSVTMEKFTGN